MLHSLRLDKLSEQNYPIDLHNLQKEGERKGERKGEREKEERKKEKEERKGKRKSAEVSVS